MCHVLKPRSEWLPNFYCAAANNDDRQWRHLQDKLAAVSHTAPFQTPIYSVQNQSISRTPSPHSAKKNLGLLGIQLNASSTLPITSEVVSEALFFAIEREKGTRAATKTEHFN